MEEYEKNHLEAIYKYLPECMVLLKSNGDFPIKDKDIALYGSGVRKTIKGGTGSGEVNSRFFVNIEEGLKNKGFNIKTIDWLDRYDKEYIKNKKRFKKHLKIVAKEKKQMLFIASMGEVMPEGEYNIPINVECDNAIYVLSRISGEGADRRLVKGDVYLTGTEIRDINYLNNKYKRFMLVLNVGGVVDLSQVINVKNILLLSQLGVETGNALADVLLGNLNPSGKLSTTWTNPNDYQNIGTFGDPNDTLYKEGIYVGYRYFDTLNKNVLFPFGYGLSYTKFEINILDTKVDNTIVNIKVNVKNIGKYTGKEVIEAYISKPNNRLDNPYQDLAGFSKTKELKPNEDEDLIISFDLTDISSYDKENMSYILESGKYILRVGNSSRDTKVAAILELDEDVDIKRVKNLFKSPDFDDFKGFNRNDDKDSTNVIKIDSRAFKKEKINYEFNYEILDEIKALSDEDLMKINMGLFNAQGGIKSVVGESGVKVPGAAGETYNTKSIKGVVMSDGPQGLRIARDYFVDKKGVHSSSSLIPESMKEYMPWYIRLFLFMMTPKRGKNELLHQYTTAIPIGTAIAQSFNKDLAYDIGNIIGSEMEIFNIGLWLAPALNIHRSILCGRNFEYYSEDPYLSGIIAANMTKGVQSHKGCGVTIKHFLCNNQEYNRYVNNSVVSERAIREIYLRGFEIAIKYSKPKAVMTSYNLLNGIHTSENNKVNDYLLRSELKHEGIIMTDWVVKMMQNEYKYKNASIINVLKAHSDIFMPGSLSDYKELADGLRTGLITREDLEINASRLYKVVKELI